MTNSLENLVREFLNNLDLSSYIEDNNFDITSLNEAFLENLQRNSFHSLEYWAEIYYGYNLLKEESNCSKSV